jgi:hypothetical protein
LPDLYPPPARSVKELVVIVILWTPNLTPYEPFGVDVHDRRQNTFDCGDCGFGCWIRLTKTRIA